MPWCQVQFSSDDYMSYKAGQTDEVYVTEANAIVRNGFGKIIKGPYYKDGEPREEAAPEPLNLNPEQPKPEAAPEPEQKAADGPKADKALQPRKHRPAALTTADVRSK